MIILKGILLKERLCESILCINCTECKMLLTRHTALRKETSYNAFVQ